jgi:hypothetical protein
MVVVGAMVSTVEIGDVLFALRWSSASILATCSKSHTPQFAIACSVEKLSLVVLMEIVMGRVTDPRS